MSKKPTPSDDSTPPKQPPEQSPKPVEPINLTVAGIHPTQRLVQAPEPEPEPPAGHFVNVNIVAGQRTWTQPSIPGLIPSPPEDATRPRKSARELLDDYLAEVGKTHPGSWGRQEDFEKYAKDHGCPLPQRELRSLHRDAKQRGTGTDNVRGRPTKPTQG